MGPMDFITDHLLNLDGMFDKHVHGDPQKPHNPSLVHHQLIPTLLVPVTSISQKADVKIVCITIVNYDNFIASGFTSQLLRPPDSVIIFLSA